MMTLADQLDCLQRSFDEIPAEAFDADFHGFYCFGDHIGSSLGEACETLLDFLGYVTT